jgi:hypothetical protein
VTPEQFVAILVALTGLIGAVGALAAVVRNYHQAVDGRMDELLRLTRDASYLEGHSAATAKILLEEPDAGQLSGGVVHQLESGRTDISPI